MRLVTFRTPEGPRPGLVTGEAIADLGARWPSLLSLLEAGAAALREVEAVAAEATRIDAEGAALASPLPAPTVYCVGWNYLKHFEEGAAKRDEELPEHPAFFSKSPPSVIGPFDPIPSHAQVTSQLDWETELAVVIGTEGRDIPVERALDHVVGYMAANDVSAREVQRRHGGQWLKGKSLDGTCPLGPWIATRDEVPDPQTLEVWARVNGDEKQRSSTARMIFPVAELIARLSEGMTLRVGDVLLTGTPEGVGMGRDPQEFLAPGDVVECGVDGIGSVRNHVV